MLVLVTLALLVNQLAVSIYVTAVHAGDPAFVARHLPSGWFDLWTPDWLVRIARGWPGPELLAPSVLVVPALLELPFVLAAYLLVARWLDESVHRRLAAPSLLWTASAVWTTTFCLVATLAVREAVRAEGRGRVGPVLAAAAGIALAGAVVAVVVARLTTTTHVEAALGFGVVVGFVAVVGLAEATDFLTRSRGCRARP